MKLSKSIKLGAALIIFLNLSMAVGSIWVFQRMTPSIENIIDRNGKSLKACGSMLELLVLRDQPAASNLGPDSDVVTTSGSLVGDAFQEQLEIAKSNITEPDEDEVLVRIGNYYPAALAGDPQAMEKTVMAISQLRDLNWDATYQADLRAKQIGNAGAWGVCFMGIVVFMAFLVFIRRVERNLLEPFEEIASVLGERAKGNVMRRCSLYSRSADVKKVYSLVNDLMDQESQG